MPVMNIIFGRMVGSFTGYFSEDAATTYELFKNAISTCALYLVGLFFIRLVLDYVAYMGFRMCSLRISAAIRLEYMKCLFGQPVSTLDVLPPGQTAAIITITASVLQMGISEKLSALFQSLSTVISALIIAMCYSWSLTLVTASGLVLITIVYGATTPFIVKLLNEVQHADIQASTAANEIFSSIRMISACGAEEKMANRYRKWVDESRRRGLKMSPLVALQQAPVQFAVYATFALSFWYSFKMYMELRFNSSEVLIVVLMSVMLMTTSIGGITGPLSAAARAAGAATIFYSIIDAPRKDKSGVKAPEASASEDIVLEYVNFAYSTRPDLKILDNLSLRLPAGKVTAIVGPSGAGKSTIVGLLERWYEIEALESGDMSLWWRNGSISVGGRPLREIDLKWWRSQIGLVQQEPFLFNDSIYRNVEFGLIGTEWEDADLETKKDLVKQACKEAYADEFISRLPEGYSTIVGESGIKMSGGQRQRLAIARSIVKRPKILILDEATSSIDVRGEQVVQAALEKVSKNRTTLMIAHRLATVKKADNIIVLQKGRLVQQGTHEDLMAQEGGAYWTLATAQQLAPAADDNLDEPALSIDTEVVEKKSMATIGTDTVTIIETTTTASQEGEDKKSRGFWGSFWLLLYEQKSRWKWYIVLILSAFCGGASQPIQAYLFATELTLFQFWGPWLPALAGFWSLMFVMLAIFVGLTYFALGWSSSTIAFHITHYYRGEYFDNILAKSVSFFDADDHSVGALTARLATDPSQLQELLGTNMAFVVISLLNVVGCLAISFYFGWKLTVVTLCSSMPLIIAAAFFRIRYETQFEKMNNEVFAESAKFATESIGAFRTVTAMTLEDTIIKRYETLLHDQIRSVFWKSSWTTLIFATADSIALLCMAFVLWYGGTLMLNLEYTSFQYMIVYIAVLQGGLGAGQWLSYGPNIAKASVAASRIIDMRGRDQPDGKLVSLDFGNLGDNDLGVKIQFSNVWFRYPTRDVPVLNGLSLMIEKGQFAAIVGPSGSGKTTVISLLERFYTAQSGRIQYNGLDIADLSLTHYRKEISLVAQEPNLFDGTLRENILIGVDEDTVTEDQLHQACRDAEIHDFIISLPEGYNTEVGTKGVMLSGGQKQRLAIARALIRDPRLLLLDEATSNLDAETEQAVQAVFERNKKNRTMVVVAHRLATVQNADVIFVLADGRVMERGDHAALLRKRGMYYQMVRSFPAPTLAAHIGWLQLTFNSANLKRWIGSLSRCRASGTKTTMKPLLNILCCRVGRGEELLFVTGRPVHVDVRYRRT
ncbi:P-loop containing nucleoside triphosphate hydrolase protein [Lasiosphaeris hirsuta]|uniref:P-loop containing nucleoside triphosphate hydrolase protein n=1 Tax=Lasiosphaeris hirsuta TaxID=260670 RepID=A0AA40A1K4_9PEZI|nr:P-loop containing nucleoside triphosphate hydrolase protein [Lasiosphaeris hirsuta]